MEKSEPKRPMSMQPKSVPAVAIKLAKPQHFPKSDKKASLLGRLIVRQFGQRIIDRAIQTPYYHLEDYMLRYWLVQPKSKRGEVVEGFLKDIRDLGVRIHCLLRSDRDAAVHNHPWWNISFILKGCYWEVIPLAGKSPHRIPKGAVLIEDPEHEPAYAVFRPQGSLIIRRPNTRHRLVVNLDELDGDNGVWTMFMTFGKAREWGFYIPSLPDTSMTQWLIWWKYIGVDPNEAEPGPGVVGKARPTYPGLQTFEQRSGPTQTSK